MNSSFKFLNFSPAPKSIDNPLAESTAIGSPLSRQVHGNVKKRSISPLNNSNKVRTAIKIDQHVLTDAQSSGIVSRLVKYYDQSTESDRNRIVYNKFGDFPLVQLKKSEIKRPISRTSSVRIAPPCKSVMNPSLRAAIMRSNSFAMGSGSPKVVATKMRSKDDSHQIITNHDPIHLDSVYASSTKSVLDALEKNCRKRINNEELTLDRSKKFCISQAQNQSEVDALSTRDFMQIQQSHTKKRDREPNSPPKIKSSYLRNENNSQIQQPFKKMKTKNNALLSSLSSSYFNLIPYNNITALTNSSKPVSLKGKLQTDQSKEISSLEKVTNEQSTSSSPQLVMPLETMKTAVPGSYGSVVNKDTNPVEPRKKLHLFNRQPDPNAAINKAKLKSFTTDDDEDDDSIKINFVKPKEFAAENCEHQNFGQSSHSESEKLSKMLVGLGKGLKSSSLKEYDTIDNKTKDENADAKSKSSASISFSTFTTVSTNAPISSASSVLMSSPVHTIKPMNEINAEKSDVKESSLCPKTDSITNASKTTMNNSPNIESANNLPETSSSTAVATSSVITAISPLVSSAVTSTNTVTKPVFGSSSNTSKSLISFSPLAKNTNLEISKPNTISAISTESSGNTKTDSTGGFSFGSAPSTKTELGTLAFSFGANASKQLPVTQSEKTSAISFGSTTLPKLDSSISSAQSLTNSLLPTISTQASDAGPTVLKPLASSNFSFGAIANNGSGVALPNMLSSNKPETTIASGIGFSFGNGNSAVGTFSFGDKKTQSSTSTKTTMMTSLAPTGLQKPETPVINSTFSLGQQKSQLSEPASKPNTTVSFNFGSSSIPATSSQASNGFNFKSNSNEVQGGLFSKPPTSASDEVKLFSFNTNQQSTINPFGNSTVVSSSSSSIFNQSTSVSTAFGQPSVTTNNSSNLFAENKPNSVFGGNSQIHQHQPQQQGSTSMFSFGNNESMAKANNAQPLTGGMFNFNNNVNNSNNINNNNIVSSNSNSSASIFGAVNNNNASSQNVSASFVFNPNTRGISSSALPVSHQNLFGQQNQNPTSTSSASSPPAYQFGNSTNVSTSFAFSSGVHTAPTPQTNNGNKFSFGNSTAPVAGTFNFQAQAQPPQSSGGGMFSIGTGGNQNQRRPIRTATRRYK